MFEQSLTCFAAMLMPNESIVRCLILMIVFLIRILPKIWCMHTIPTEYTILMNTGPFDTNVTELLSFWSPEGKGPGNYR